MADVGQTGLSGEQSRRCLVFKFDLMSYNKTVNDLISVNTRIDQPMKHDIHLGCLGEYHVPWVDQSLYSPHRKSSCLLTNHYYS